jgi:hypothetical protein
MSKLTPYRQERADAGHCMSSNDGDCDWSECPQLTNYKSTCPRHAADAARHATLGEDEGRGGG